MAGEDWQSQQTRQTRRPRRLEEVNSTEIGFPIAWVIVGMLAGLLVLGLVGLGVVNIVRQQAITPTPSVIPGLAPTQAIADATSAAPIGEATPTIPPVVTLEPTETPPPTATAIPTVPANIAVGVYVEVINTDGFGVSLRAGPGTNNARLGVGQEGDKLLVLDGPRQDENGEDFTWWLLRNPSGEEGWSVQEFLNPTLPPENNSGQPAVPSSDGTE